MSANGNSQGRLLEIEASLGYLALLDRTVSASNVELFDYIKAIENDILKIHEMELCVSLCRDS
jgi:hypothetical protein